MTSEGVKKLAKFSNSQKIAYYSGMGYRVAHEKKGITFNKPESRVSFSKGYTAAGKMMAKSPSKYPALKRKTTKKNGGSTKK